MKTITAISMLLCLTATAFLGCSQEEKKVSLRMKFEPGMGLTYKQFARQQTQVIEADTVATNDTITFHADVYQEVTRLINDTTAELLQRDTWVYRSMRQPDSTDKKAMDTLVNEMIMVMLTNGKVEDFKLLNDKAESQSRYARLKNYFEQGLPVFPSGLNAPGFKWTQNTTVMLPDEKMEASTTYLIKSVVREMGYDCAVIEYNGNMLIPIESSPEDTLQRTGIDRIKTDGIMYFAYKDGFIVSQREHWEINGERNMVKNGKPTSYQVKQDYDVEFSLVDRSST